MASLSNISESVIASASDNATLDMSYKSNQLKPQKELLPGCLFEWIDEVGSTQDEAKLRIPELLPLSKRNEPLKEQHASVSGSDGSSSSSVCGGAKKCEMFAVSAGMQNKGRGSNGRVWNGSPGNVFLSIVIPLEAIPIPLTLTPLKIGILIHQTLDEHFIAAAQKTHIANNSKSEESGSTDNCDSKFTMDNKPVVSLKWPNDVLVNRNKIAGVLVEGDGKNLIIGMGINVLYAPEIPNMGPERGRKSTCLADFLPNLPPDTNQQIAEALTTKFAQWILVHQSTSSSTSGGFGSFSSQPKRSDVIAHAAEQVRNEWSRLCDWQHELVVRDEGIEVKPLRLQEDGQLLVREMKSGKQRLLCSNYLL